MNYPVYRLSQRDKIIKYKHTIEDLYQLICYLLVVSIK